MTLINKENMIMMILETIESISYSLKHRLEIKMLNSSNSVWLTSINQNERNFE